jgi:predicted nucleic acid-binding protein
MQETYSQTDVHHKAVQQTFVMLETNEFPSILSRPFVMSFLYAGSRSLFDLVVISHQKI